MCWCEPGDVMLGGPGAECHMPVGFGASNIVCRRVVLGTDWMLVLPCVHIFCFDLCRTGKSKVPRANPMVGDMVLSARLNALQLHGAIWGPCHWR
jgi:hypothetical protein